MPRTKGAAEIITQLGDSCKCFSMQKFETYFWLFRPWGVFLIIHNQRRCCVPQILYFLHIRGGGGGGAEFSELDQQHLP